MGGPDFIALPSAVAPGQTIDISVTGVVPGILGKHQGNWVFRAPDGAQFGVGPAADKPIWIKIRAVPATAGISPTSPSLPLSSPTVTLPSGRQAPGPLEITYDFVKNACLARWESAKGLLPCPGLDGDPAGFVIPLARANLEDGTIVNQPTLLTFPQYLGDGFIQGTYPEYQVSAGDHFQTTSSCELGATSCSALFQLSVLDAAGAKSDLWTLGEFYDGKYFHLDRDLSALAGKKVRFILRIYALGSPVDDRALWVAPQILHFVVTPIPPTPTPTIAVGTPTPSLTSTPTTAPTPVPTPPATPAPGSQNALPSLAQLYDMFVAFLRHLFGK